MAHATRGATSQSQTRKYWASLSIGLILICSTHAISVLRISAFADDYAFLDDVIYGKGDLQAFYIAAGRPGAALLFPLSFEWVDSVTDLSFIRAAALAGLVVCFLVLSFSFRDSRHSALLNVVMAAGFALPTFMFYTAWAAMWAASWQMLSGVVAWIAWSLGGPWRRMLGAVLMGFSLSQYTPTSLFFFAALAVQAAAYSKSSKWLLQRVVSAGALVGLGSGLAALGSVVAARLAGVPFDDRVQVVGLQDMPDKLWWFLSRPVVFSLRPFAFDSPEAPVALVTSIPIAVLVFRLMVTQAKELGERRLLRIFSMSLPLLLSISSVLVVSENTSEHRVLPGATWGVLVLGCLGIVGLAADSAPLLLHIRQNLLKRVGHLVALVLVVAAPWHSTDRYFALIGDPYRQKNDFIATSLAACPTPLQNIVVLPPEEYFPTHSRWGMFSMATDLSQPWVPEPSVRLVARDLGHDVPVRYAESREGETGIQECVIDLEFYRVDLLNQLNLGRSSWISLRFPDAAGSNP